MLRPYTDVLRRPGALAFSSAGLLARMPMSTLGIGIVLLVSLTTGSYAAAGAVAAACTLAQAVALPVLGRLVDRHGQARVMRPAVLVHLVAVVLLAATVTAGWSLWLAGGLAVVAGATVGSPGSLVRARWSHLLGDSPRLHAAFSWEAVLDEVVFIVGPVVVTLVATTVHPAAGVLFAAAAVAVGFPLLLAQRGTEPPLTVREVGAPRRRPVWAMPVVAVLVVAYVLLGGVFGSVEVVTVAFTESLGGAAAAGPVLAVFALASLLAGLVVGAVRTAGSPAVLLLGSALVLAVGAVLTLLATSAVGLAGALVVTGAGIAPIMISGTTLVRDAVDPDRFTEGMAWTTTALNLGTAAAASLVGHVIDARGPDAGFLLPAGCGVAAFVVVLVGLPWLVRAPRPAAPLTGA